MERKTYKYFRVISIALILILGASTTYLGLVTQGVIEYKNGKYIKDKEYKQFQANKKRYAKIENLENYVKTFFYKDTADVDFEEGLIDGVFSALDDPYSVYFNADEFKKFREMNKGSYGGLGISISPPKDGSYITVIAPFEDTPAYKAGIKPKDKIVKVDGVKYKADEMEMAIKAMKGEPGTKVTLTILRDGKEFDVAMNREQIVIKSVKSSLVEGNKDIGYLRITTFDEKVYSEFVENLDKLLLQGVKGLVIDLRDNPGGSLSEVVKVADRLLGKQVIVSVKDRNGDKEVFNSDNRELGIPYVVLVNGNSASASEILTGAIKDTKSGTIIGTKTFGKGLVQTVIPLASGDGFKLTIAQYFTPSGAYIHEKGIEPDVKLELAKDFNVLDKSTDNQLQKAVEVLKSKFN